MQKVKLVSKAEGYQYIDKGYTLLKNFYANKDAVILQEGNKDGVFYVKNFPKDIMIKVTEDMKKEDLTNLGLVIEDKDVFPNNIIIKKKERKDVYVVKPLDSIISVCDKLNISEEELIKMNNLKTKTLFVGQRLIID